jgi:hypothetical protein
MQGVCDAQVPAPCFDGVTADLTGGTCVAGTRTCADGTGYGVCSGQIAPQPSACQGTISWSCGGAVASCGPGLSAQAFDGSASQKITGLVVDQDGGAIFVIPMAAAGDVDIGGFERHIAEPGVIVGKVDASGRGVWAQAITGPAGATLALGGGKVFVGGSFVGQVAIGDRTITDAGGLQSGYLVALGASDGVVAWARRLEISGVATINALAIAPDANLIVAGSFIGTTQFNATPITSNGAQTAAYALELDVKSGDVPWSRAIALGGVDLAVHAVAVVPSGGDLVLVGAKIDSGPCAVAPHYIRLSSGGALVSQGTFPFVGAANGVVDDGESGVWITGAVHGTASVKGQATFADGFLLHLKDTGSSTGLRSLAGWEGHAIARDASGSLIVGGSATDGSASGRVLKVDGGGHVFYDEPLVATPGGGDKTAALSVEAVAVAPNADVLLAGGLQGTANFGTGATPPAAASTTDLDAWIARLAP